MKTIKKKVNVADRRTLTVSECAKALGVSLGTMYKVVNDGQVPVLRLGKRLLIPSAALDRFLSEARAKTEAVNAA